MNKQTIDARKANILAAYENPDYILRSEHIKTCNKYKKEIQSLKDTIEHQRGIIDRSFSC